MGKVYKKIRFSRKVESDAAKVCEVHQREVGRAPAPGGMEEPFGVAAHDQEVEAMDREAG